MARVSFTALPLELKARIVEMASDQEDAYKERYGEFERCTGYGNMPGSEGHIDCLSSLALVNKELRELAAKHQFMVLTPKQASKPIFPFHILRTFPHRVIEIDFTEDRNTTGIDAIFQSMNQLPSLRTLRLFGPISGLEYDPEDDMRTYRIDILASIGPQIETLVLDELPSSVCVSFIGHLPNVKTLGLINIRPMDEEGHVRDLASAIASLRRLNSLTIDLAGLTSDDWTDDALAPLEREPPPIRYLQLGYFPLGVPVIRLTRIFSSSLRTLCLQLRDGAEEADLDYISPVQLPLLKSFILEGRAPSYPTEISRLLLSSSTLTSFSYNRLGPDNAPDSPVLAFLASQPSLRRVELGGTISIFPMCKNYSTPPLPSFIAAYANLVQSRGLDPSVLDAPHLSPFHPLAKLNYMEEEVHLVTAALGRTLAFGQVELERMVAEGNVKKAVGWVATLKALENERLAWMD